MDHESKVSDICSGFYMCTFIGSSSSVCPGFGDLRITGPHSQDHYLYMFSVRAGDPINLELKLSKYIGFWNPQGLQWINVTVYDSNSSHVWSEYVETDIWSGVAKPKTFSINKTGTYILAANYTNRTDHCFAAMMFFVL